MSALALFFLRCLQSFIGVKVIFVQRLRSFGQLLLLACYFTGCGVRIQLLLLTFLFGDSTLLRRKWFAATLAFGGYFSGGGCSGVICVQFVIRHQHTLGGNALPVFINTIRVLADVNFKSVVGAAFRTINYFGYFGRGTGIARLRNFCAGGKICPRLAVN